MPEVALQAARDTGRGSATHDAPILPSNRKSGGSRCIRGHPAHALAPSADRHCHVPRPDQEQVTPSAERADAADHPVALTFVSGAPSKVMNWAEDQTRLPSRWRPEK